MPHRPQVRAMKMMSVHAYKPDWWPKAKIVKAFWGMLFILLGVTALNQWVLTPDNRIDMPWSAYLAPMVTLLLAYLARPEPGEGVAVVPKS